MRNIINRNKKHLKNSDEIFPFPMDKRQFYKEQAEKFRDYASKFPDGNLLSLFNEWAESKDIYGKDKHEIWRIARTIRPSESVVIKENSDEFIRIDSVLKILLEADLKRLDKLLEKREKSDRKNKLDKT